MEQCALTAEQLIARALLLGMQVREWGGVHNGIPDAVNEHSKHVKLCLINGAGGLLAMSMEMAAHRWLKRIHPSALIPVAQAPASSVVDGKSS